MEVTSKFVRKAITQIITVYQGVLNIELKDIGVELSIKPNKNIDDMLDVINNELINVCGEYLEGHSLNLDKYQLATICAELMTLAMERCEEPFWISVKTSKALVKEYLEANKAKRETLERIKKENESLDKEVALREKERQEKKAILRPKPEMPSEKLETGASGSYAPAPKPKKPRARGTDALAIEFNLPKG